MKRMINLWLVTLRSSLLTLSAGTLLVLGGPAAAGTPISGLRLASDADGGGYAITNIVIILPDGTVISNASILLAKNWSTNAATSTLDMAGHSVTNARYYGDGQGITNIIASSTNTTDLEARAAASNAQERVAIVENTGVTTNHTGPLALNGVFSCNQTIGLWDFEPFGAFDWIKAYNGRLIVRSEAMGTQTVAYLRDTNALASTSSVANIAVQLTALSIDLANATVGLGAVSNHAHGAWGNYTGVVWVSKQGNDSNNGLTRAGAKLTIAGALAVCPTYGTVLVLPGVYTNSDELTVANGVTLRSVAGPDVTVIDGSNLFRCATVIAASIEGFWLRNGYNNHILSGVAGGGGLAGTQGSLVEGCIISGNQVEQIGTPNYTDGGGAFLEGDSRMLSCIVTGNAILSDGAMLGGGVMLYGASIENCTVVGNSVGPSGTYGSDDIGYPPGSYGDVIINCIAGCIYAETYSASSTNIINTCFTNGVRWLCPIPPGCITNAPQFVSSTDLHLQPTSPCLNTGTNELWMVNAKDIEGNPRLQGTVDMGAYERGGFPTRSEIVASTDAGVTNHTHVLSDILNAGTAAFSNATAFALAIHTHLLSSITDAGTAAYSNATAFALAIHTHAASSITNWPTTTNGYQFGSGDSAVADTIRTNWWSSTSVSQCVNLVRGQQVLGSSVHILVTNMSSPGYWLGPYVLRTTGGVWTVTGGGLPLGMTWGRAITNVTAGTGSVLNVEAYNP